METNQDPLTLDLGLVTIDLRERFSPEECEQFLQQARLAGVSPVTWYQTGWEPEKSHEEQMAWLQAQMADGLQDQGYPPLPSLPANCIAWERVANNAHYVGSFCFATPGMGSWCMSRTSICNEEQMPGVIHMRAVLFPSKTLYPPGGPACAESRSPEDAPTNSVDVVPRSDGNQAGSSLPLSPPGRAACADSGHPADGTGTGMCCSGLPGRSNRTRAGYAYLLLPGGRMLSSAGALVEAGGR